MKWPDPNIDLHHSHSNTIPHVHPHPSVYERKCTTSSHWSTHDYSPTNEHTFFTSTHTPRLTPHKHVQAEVQAICTHCTMATCCIYSTWSIWRPYTNYTPLIDLPISSVQTILHHWTFPKPGSAASWQIAPTTPLQSVYPAPRCFMWVLTGSALPVSYPSDLSL